MAFDVVIVHFNTPELTVAVVKSILKHTPDCRITVFDNSDRLPFIPIEGVRIIDNTKGQIIDFDKFLDLFPNKAKTTTNNYGSDKHCYTIQKLWEYFPEGFVLVDSDALTKTDLSSLVDRHYAWAGRVYVNPKRRNKLVPRLYPFLCWINVPMCREAGVRYFDPEHSWELTGTSNPYSWYDTGAAFLKDCNEHRLPGKSIDLKTYIVHFGRASYSGHDWHEWLQQHRELYE